MQYSECEKTQSKTLEVHLSPATLVRGIAHILDILLMNSYNTVIFLAPTIICSLSALHELRGVRSREEAVSA